MPNWCWNNTVIYGEQKVLKKFYNDMKSGLSKNPHFEPVKNSWNNLWLGNLFLAAGYTKEDVESGEISCRGGVDSINWIKDDTAIQITYETAWCPIINSFDKMLKEKYTGLKQVTLAEECGLECYVNTDEKGIYFDERYYFDYCVNDDYCEEHYYSSEEDLVKAFNEIFKCNVTSYDEIQKVIPDLREKYEEDDDFFISVNEYGLWD